MRSCKRSWPAAALGTAGPSLGTPVSKAVAARFFKRFSLPATLAVGASIDPSFDIAIPPTKEPRTVGHMLDQTLGDFVLTLNAAKPIGYWWNLRALAGQQFETYRLFVIARRVEPPRKGTRTAHFWCSYSQHLHDSASRQYFTGETRLQTPHLIRVSPVPLTGDRLDGILPVPVCADTKNTIVLRIRSIVSRGPTLERTAHPSAVSRTDLSQIPSGALWLAFTQAQELHLMQRRTSRKLSFRTHPV